MNGLTSILIVIALVGLGCGFLTRISMPGGVAWLTALIGLDGSLLGVYVSRRLLGRPGEGTLLFAALALSFLLLTLFRTVHFGRVDGVEQKH